MGETPGKNSRDPLAKLSAKKRKYVKGRAEGKTKRQAARDAGYSDATARNAREKIETRDVQEAFARLIRKRIPAKKIAERIAQGLDAIETETFSHVIGSKLKGTEEIKLEHVDKIAWTERRKYAELAVDLGGYSSTRTSGKIGDMKLKVVIERVGA